MSTVIHNENNDRVMRVHIEHSMVMVTDLKEEELGAKICTAAASTIMAESLQIRTHHRSMFLCIHPS